METPIWDFVTRYRDADFVRAHMPGHKGQSILGCEALDITEIAGADALYEASGIIARSEENAAALFGAAATRYSTEGSSLCVRTMLYLALLRSGGRRTVVAARNVHRSFLSACALLDLAVVWLWPEDENYALCRCTVGAEQLRRTLAGLKERPIAVYITSPDYLGGTADVSALAAAAHAFGVPLLVDNAHGAYLRFAESSRHPLDLGADLCCDSAHKTLPVLTGGAYLHVAKEAPPEFVERVSAAMGLFGSTSPSYLTLASLDLANRCLAGNYARRLAECFHRVENLREQLRRAGWLVESTEALKLTVASAQSGWEGPTLAEALRRERVECEYADPDYLVLMLTPENSEEDFRRIAEAFLKLNPGTALSRPMLCPPRPEMHCSVREAMFAPQEMVSVREALGRVLGAATVGCPPAVPAAVCGETISREVQGVLQYYRMDRVSVLRI